MCKGNVRMLEGEILGLIKLFQPNDKVVGGDINPATFWNKGSTGFLKLGVIENSLANGRCRRTLNIDFVASCDESLGCGRGKS